MAAVFTKFIYCLCKPIFKRDILGVICTELKRELIGAVARKAATFGFRMHPQTPDVKLSVKLYLNLTFICPSIKITSG